MKETGEKRILYSCFSSEDKQPFGAIRQAEPCRMRLRVPTSCPVKTVTLKLWGEDGCVTAVPLCRAEETDGYIAYRAVFTLTKTGLYRYAFLFDTEISSFTLYCKGKEDTNMEEGTYWQLTCMPRDYDVPRRFMGRVMYQIFPDRFAQNGVCDLTDKLTPYRLHADTAELPIDVPDGEGRWNTDFFGGNLNGIRERLDYLKSFGVGVIYLNPIFLSPSNHRYDTADYKRIDPMLGTEEDFIALCREARERDIYVILDGVFSHVGSDSRYFDRELRFGGGAVSDESSPYRSWFTFESYPDTYECWWNIPTLPCVREMEPSYLDYIVRDEDSVVSYWMKRGASGFRLDVADELPDEFILHLRRRVKELDPEALVIGEIWEDASNKESYGKIRHYYSDGELDGVMNYPFRRTLLDLCFGLVDGKSAAESMMDLIEHYPAFAIHTCMSFLSSHDVPRVMTEIKETRGEGMALYLMKALAVIQYLLPGMPSIYYGDETGMEGGKDPFNRGYFTENTPYASTLTEHYRFLGRLRAEHPALRYGKTEITGEGDALTVLRYTEEEWVKGTVSMKDGGYILTFSSEDERKG